MKKITTSIESYSINSKEIFGLAREEALRLKNNYIGTEHFLLGIIIISDSLNFDLFQKAGLNPDRLRKAIEISIKGRTINSLKNLDNIPLTIQAGKVLENMVLEAPILNSRKINILHLLIAILNDEENYGCKILNLLNINYKIMNDILQQIEPNKFEKIEKSVSENSLSKHLQINLGDNLYKIFNWIITIYQKLIRF
jgi:ATP-dependent Clp protease ATP-binding subunit ClpC